MTTPRRLSVEGTHTYIGQHHTLEGVSLEVSRGSIGAGKTTTLRSAPVSAASPLG
jgi:ABC-type branched-subunit amino acid transport system ATPase component